MPVDNIAEIANLLGATIQAPQLPPGGAEQILGGGFPTLPQGTPIPGPQGPSIGSLALGDLQQGTPFDLFPSGGAPNDGSAALQALAALQAPGQLPQQFPPVATQSVRPDSGGRATAFPNAGGAPQAQNILAQLFSGLLGGGR